VIDLLVKISWGKSNCGFERLLYKQGSSWRSDGSNFTTLIYIIGRNDCSQADPCECDLDGDGDVDDVDLLLFSEDHGRF